jgi:hypothetical protein
MRTVFASLLIVQAARAADAHDSRPRSVPFLSRRLPAEDVI